MSAPRIGSAAQRGSAAQGWALRVLLALAPLWFIGIADRGLWTPDEPREADIAWRMSHQANLALPELAGTPFLEKPPLSYWMSAAGLRLFGETAALAARTPNILYAVLTALAIGALALAMVDGAAAAVAPLIAATTIIVFRVTVWLAPDACLLAGCAISLLGVYLGYTSPRGRGKLSGYCLMHAGAAMGFMAKSAPGWMAPALALGALIVWERRWSELARWELYAGLAIQALIIGPWVVAVYYSPNGADALLALFWHNVVGRFTKIPAPSGLDYSTGHKAAPGKYFLELPVYLLPWSLLVAAALGHAWRKVRMPSPAGTPWRFALAASIPFLLVLSLAATARDIYSAPALLGLSLLVALWMADTQHTRLDEVALRATRWLIALLGLIYAGLPATLALARFAVGYVIAAVLVLVVFVSGLYLSARAQQRRDRYGSFWWMYGAYVGALCVMAVGIFPTVDRWQDLGLLARQIKADTGHCDLALLAPDETTIAMLDNGLSTRFTALSTATRDPASAVDGWLKEHGDSARVLVQLPDHAPGDLSRLMERFRHGKPPNEGVVGTLKSRGIAVEEHRYQLPQGRQYALLGPTSPPKQR